MKPLPTALVLLLIILAAALLPTRPYLDFQVLYHANLGLLRGISLYDHAGQVDLIAGLANVPPSEVYALPFPYPPWYALSTLWLALLPIALAARVWFAVNLVLLFSAVGLLTANERPSHRVGSLIGALVWLPALGSLFVGQYGIPVLFGAALMIHALQHQKAVTFAAAAALLTLKPHLGGLLLILAVISLLQRRDSFAPRAVRGACVAGVVLLGAGFLASPNWPLEYFRSLMSFRDVSQCAQCVSVPMTLARLFGGDFGQATAIAFLLAILLGVWLVMRWNFVVSTGSDLAVVAILLTLLVSPYLANYDYLLLVLPFIKLAGILRSPIERTGLAVAYVLPFIALALLGSAGNGSLIISTGILFAVVAFHLGSHTEEPATYE